eukprot:SM000328S12469  [mRNA]  locus=s328:19945:26895:- [translate_table: standard]
MLSSADKRSITLEWAETPSAACYYLDMALESPAPPPRSASQPKVLPAQQPPHDQAPQKKAADGSPTAAAPWPADAAIAAPPAGPQWVAVYCGKARRFKAENLKAGRRYLFRVRVVPSSMPMLAHTGAALPSPPAVFATLQDVPEAPPPCQLVTRARANLKVKWGPSSDSGGMPVTEYVLEMRPAPGKGDNEGGFVSDSEIYAGDELDYKVSRLAAGVEYTFRVQAVNCIGRSKHSQATVYSTAASVPAAPAPPSLMTATATSITVDWQEPACCGAPISAYMLEIDDGCGGPFNPVYTGESSSCEVRGLQSGRVYRFRVTAQNEVGRSTPSLPTELSTGMSAPAAPCRLTSSQRHSNSFALSWQPPAHDGGSPITGYEVEYALALASGRQGDDDTAGNDVNWLVGYSGVSTSCIVCNVKPGRQYRTRVQAINAAGKSEHSEEVVAATAPAAPDAPAAPSVVERLSTSLTVGWRPPSHDGGSPITSYRLEMQLGASGGGGEPEGLRKSSCVYSGPSTSSAVAGLRPGATYTFRLQAVNQFGASAWSTLTTMATMCGPPGLMGPPVVALAPTFCTISLRWASAEDHGSPVIGYRLQMRCLGAGQSRVHDSEGASVSGGFGGEQLELLELPPSTNGAGGAPGDHWERRRTRGRRRGAGGGVLEMEIARSRELERDETVGVIEEGGGLVWGDTGSESSSTVGSTCSASSFEDVFQGALQAHTVGRLQPFTSYAFRIQAINKEGAGPFSHPTVVVTAAAAPSAPHPPQIVDISNSTLLLQWEEPERDNGSALKGFVLQMARPAGMTGSSSLGLAAAKGQLKPSSSTSSNLSSLGSSGTLSIMPHTSPSSDGGGRSLGNGGGKGRRSGKSGGKGAGAVASQWPQRSSSTGNIMRLHSSPTLSEAWEDTYVGPDLQYEVNGLQAGQRYLFRVLARNAAGMSAASGVAVGVTAAAAPAAPLAPFLDGPLAPTSARIRCYKMLMDDGQGGPFRKVFEGSATCFKLSRLIPAQTYNVKVQAINGVGVSQASELLSFTLPVAPLATPAAPQVVQSTSNSLCVDWAAALTPAAAARYEGPDSGMEGCSAKDCGETGIATSTYTLEMESHVGASSHSQVVYEGPLTRHFVQALAANTQYRFRVRVNGPPNSELASPWSAATVGTTLPAHPSKGSQTSTRHRTPTNEQALPARITLPFSVNFMQLQSSMRLSLQMRRILAVLGTLLTLAAACYHGLK